MFAFSRQAMHPQSLFPAQCQHFAAVAIARKYAYGRRVPMRRSCKSRVCARGAAADCRDDFGVNRCRITSIAAGPAPGARPDDVGDAMVRRETAFTLSVVRVGDRLSGKSVHVVLIDRRWAVVRSGDLTPLSVHDQRRDAVVQARAVARREGVDVVVFDVGGRPLPPGASDVMP